MTRTLSAALALVLWVGLASPVRAQEPCRAQSWGCFRDAEGDLQSVEASLRLARTDRVPDYLRAAIEEAVVLMGGVAWYWIDEEHNVADWDFESWEQRMTWDAFRYDNNTFHMNFLFHPLSGSAFHAIPRANDLSFGASTAYAFLTSFAWEFLAEFRERVSINDTIVTTAAGTGIGEFMFRLGTLLDRHPDVSPALRWTLGIPVALHDALDGEDAAEDEGRPLPWRRLHIAYRFSQARDDADATVGLHDVSAGGSIVAIPGYLGEGRFGQFFHEAEVASLRFRVTGSAEGAGLELLTDTTLLGYHLQDVSGGPDGPVGGALTVGASLAYLYRTEDFGLWSDRLSVTGLPGLGADGHFLMGPTRLHVGARLHGAFAGVNGASYDDWRSAHPDQTPKSILRKQGYYYGWGVWTRLEVDVELPWVSAGSALSYVHIDSHEGFDRTQELVTADVAATDESLELEAWVRVAPPALPVFIESSFTERIRRSDLGALRDTRRLRTFGVSLGALF